jgi:hypothetical protein
MKESMSVPKEKLPRQLNCAVDPVTHQILLAVQKELGLASLPAVLQRIASDFWWGKSSPIGHNKWPEA